VHPGNTVVRVKLGMWRDRFKDAEHDTDFDAQTYPELDDYLSTMEERGWSVVSLSPSATSGGVPVYLVITLHRNDGSVAVGSVELPA